MSLFVETRPSCLNSTIAHHAGTLAPLLLVSNKISCFTALHKGLPGPATNRNHGRRKEWQDTWPARHLSLDAVLTMYKTRGRKERYSRKKKGQPRRPRIVTRDQGSREGKARSSTANASQTLLRVQMKLGQKQSRLQKLLAMREPSRLK